MKCPCCGSDLEDADRPLLSLETNKLLAGTEVIKLSKREAEFMAALIRSMPLPLNRERIIAKVYGAQELEDPEKSLHVYVCKLRKKIKVAGLSIRTIWGGGYVPEYAKSEAA